MSVYLVDPTKPIEAFLPDGTIYPAHISNPAGSVYGGDAYIEVRHKIEASSDSTYTPSDWYFEYDTGVWSGGNPSTHICIRNIEPA